MSSYPSPGEKCNQANHGACNCFRRCSRWLTRYRYRQKQINAYAEKVLPAYYARKKVGGANDAKAAD